MPRAFLVKKRAPKRGSPPAGGAGGGGVLQHPREEQRKLDDIGYSSHKALKGALHHAEHTPIRKHLEEEEDEVVVVEEEDIGAPRGSPRVWAGWRPSTQEGISPERPEDGPGGRAEVPRSPSPQIRTRPREQEGTQRGREVSTGVPTPPTTMDRYGRPGAGARQGGAAFPPSPPGVVGPSPGVLPAGTPGTLGKCVTGQQLTYIRSPDAASEPERMTYHRSPDGPTSSLLSSLTSSSSVARSIGYITTSPTKKHCPRITIERSPPEGAARGAPTSGHRGGSYPDRPPLLPLPPAPPPLPLGERSPPPFVPTPGWMPSRPSTTSSLWAPHRDISGRAEDFRSPPLPPSSGFPSPPSYRETLLSFPSPDLPPPVSPVSGLQQHQQQHQQHQHHHQQHHQQQQQHQHQHQLQQQRHRSYSPLMVATTLAAGGNHHFDLDLVPGKLDPLQMPSPSPQLPVHNVFDRRSLPPPPPLPLPPVPLPSSTPHRHATSGLRVSTGNGNAMPLTPLLGVVTSGAPHHRMAEQPPPPPPPPPSVAAPRMSSGGHVHLSERGSSPRKRPYPGGEVEGILREHPRGLYDGRYASWALGGGGSGGGDGGTQAQSVPLNMSTIKENNGCKVWRDTEPLGQRPIARPRIPWGIENIPLEEEEEEDIKAMVPKKRRENDPPRYQCEACKKSYATHGGLSKHRQFHCTSIIKKEFSCKSCDKTYVSLGALKMHIRTHTLPCKCHLCGKAFARPWLLQGHIRTHTGEKPYQCAHCGRSFADRSNLRAHLQTHTDIKKYNCRSCSKSFSRMSLLSKHEDGGCGNTSV